MATGGWREPARPGSPMAESLKDHIDSFPDYPDKLAHLRSLKVLISKCSKKQLQDDLAHVNLERFFATLPSLNQEEMGLCCEVMDSLFVSLDPKILVERFSSELRDGLVMDSTPLQLICLAELKRLPIDLYEVFVDRYDSALRNMIDLITSEPLQVALSSVSALSRLGEFKQGPDILFINHLEEIKVAMRKSDVVRFRFYELVMNIASASPANLHVVINTGLLQQLLNELFEDENPDILGQMNCIELLTNLSHTDHGFTWLSENNTLRRLEVLLSKISSESILALLLPGLLMFFGCLAKERPLEICNKYKLFMQNLFAGTSSTDMTLRGIAIETLSYIGSTVEGKNILKSYSEMNTSITDIGKTIYDSATESKARAMNALATLIDLKIEDQTDELLSLTENWFNNLHENSFKLVFSYTHQPFENLRLSSHKALVSVAHQPWGIKQMKENPAFQEYLLNRTMETELEWKYSKFNIIDALVKSSSAEPILGSEYYKKLVDFHNAGPNYMECESAVVIEGSS